MTLRDLLNTEDRGLPLAKAWERDRKWSRNDTARFVNDKSEGVLAELRRRNPRLRTAQTGFWLQANQPAVFDRVHRALTTAADRDSVDLLKLLR